MQAPAGSDVNAVYHGRVVFSDWLDGMGTDREAAPDPDPQEPGRLPRDVAPEVFMLNVVARNPDGFRGDDILHILLACDLRFGDMSFFHRHEFEAGR